MVRVLAAARSTLAFVWEVITINTRTRCKSNQFSLRHLLMVVIVTAGLSALSRYAVIVRNHAIERSEALFAMRLSQDMLFVHLASNNGRWPKTWNDLSPSFAIANRGYRVPNLVWISDRIVVDFKFDPIEFSSRIEDHSLPLRVIQTGKDADFNFSSKANDGIKSFVLQCAAGWKRVPH
jgi:hypothetical protein